MDYNYCYREGQKKLVDLYIAATAVCTLAMAADAFDGFRGRKLWFPCKYFSLNATSMMLLAVAMMLPMDHNIYMFKSFADGLMKQMSLIFMPTALANFMPSLGSMSNKEILSNVVALGILVITIAVKVQIQLSHVEYIYGPLAIVPSILMLLLLAILISLAITVPTTKRRLESMCQEKHKRALKEEVSLERKQVFRIDDQRRYMMKYWVMAETSSPQFVTACSVVSTTSAVICLFAAIILAIFHFLLWTDGAIDGIESQYRDYTKWILYVQSTGVAVGTIAPTLRWFFSVSFRCSTANWNSFREGFKIEAHWTQTLVDWRDSLSALRIRQNKCKKYLHDVRWFTLTFCIGLQILIVVVSKLLVFLSTLLVSPFFLCFTHIKKFVKQTGNEAGDDTDLNLNCYVILLEGEAEFPRRVLKNICHEADNVIKTGRKKQPQNLVDLLNKFVNFKGVGQFDNDQIPSLHSKEPPNCWTLPVVTLTSIAVALSNIAKHKRERLLSSVNEGLTLTKLVEKSLDKHAELVNIGKAADICWVGVVLYMKWLDIDLRRTSLNSGNSKEVLRELSDKAEGIIKEFKKDVKDSVSKDPLSWPAKVVAANSMYRISRTILLSCEGENTQTDEELFERLSVMIADILAACLTNLPHVITTMCHHNATDKWEKSVRKAFLLLGKTEQVVELLQQQKWPALDHDKAATIEEWRALFRQDKDDQVTPASTSIAVVTASMPGSEEHLVITVDCGAHLPLS